MGKVQSKQGECYVLNAHLNPVCQVDDDCRRQKIPLCSPKFCSELSLSLCEMDQVKPLSEKCPLKVFLPPKDGVRQSAAEEAKREKAEEEKSEKEEKKNVSLKETAENTEFSFTLYDLNGHGQISNEDVERIVGRTISKALEKSLSLSASNHTIQVHLAISPDKISKNKSSQDQKETKRIANDKLESKSHCNSMDSLNPLSSPSHLNRNKYCCPSNKRIPHNTSFLQQHQSPHSQRRSCRKLSLTNDRNSACINEGIPYEQQCSTHLCSNHRQAPDCSGRKSSCLDLARTEDSKFANGCLKYEYSDADEGRRNIVPQNDGTKEEKLNRRRRRCREKRNYSQPLESPHMFKNVSKEQRYTHAEINSDLCDLAPEENFDCRHQGRLRSFDLHKSAEYPQYSSPKQQCHTNISNGFSTHHRHRHKEQEKESQWNGLTKWMEKDFSSRNHKDSDNHTHQRDKDQCKHHHIHEHIHHHYHHYVNS